MTNEILEYIQEQVYALKQDMVDAQNDAPIDANEYYESDMWYEGAIDTLEHILAKFGVNA